LLSEDILYLPIRQLGEQIRQRKLSSVELTRSYLERSERLGPKLNAYATITSELALQQAQAAEKEIAAGHYRGPLHGIPYAAKDLVAVKGYPTTWGAPPFANQQFDYNATVIERLNRAGAVLIGKAAMIELAGGLGYQTGDASLTGPSRNPWNTDYWTCGSSSGSGAIVSAALAPWAIGSDTGGSTICPAAWCGIAGMRPSYGRVSRNGAMAIAYSMDKLTPMARTADDCGLILSVMAGFDPGDQGSLPDELSAFPYSTPSHSGRPLRIGRVTNVWSDAEPGVREVVDEALKVMEKAGAKVSDVEIPDGPYMSAASLTTMMEATAAFRDLIHSGRCAELNDPLGRINGYASEQFSAADYLQVQQVRVILQKRMDALFDDFDVLSGAGQNYAAALIKAPPDAGMESAFEQKQFDGISSLCGLPALTVPCGFNKDKLPLGIQFVGRALNDHAVIAAARTFQEHSEWHKQRPPIG
jgi:aspartyl-tRNA(Asn)/glutamyl-tRNA(Gln) amidotransferase subunit A